MTLRRLRASRWQGGSRAVRYGNNSSGVNGPGCATWASSARTMTGRLDDSNPRVAMTVNSSLVAFGQAEPSLKIEIVLDLLKLSRADKKAGQEADHQPGHVLANGSSFRSNRSINSLNFVWRSSRLSPPGSRVAATFSMSLTYSWIDSCSAWTCSNPRSMQPASRPSCFSANPLFSRPSSVGSTRRTSFKAAAIRRPGGWSGPP